VFDHGSDSLEPSGLSEPLPRYASVTIIGGGVMGVSTAFHLARAGIGVFWSLNEACLDLDPQRSRWVGSGQRSQIQATSCWRNAAWKRTSDSEPSSGSTSAFGGGVPVLMPHRDRPGSGGIVDGITEPPRRLVGVGEP
jgi:glycine/D-amino acid oxidase-like deaminating enzyme